MRRDKTRSTFIHFSSYVIDSPERFSDTINMGLRLWYLLIMFVIFSGPKVFADEVQYEVGGGYAYFAGLPLKSLAPKTGVMARFGAEAGRKSIFKWMSNFSLMSASDTSTFSDNGTTQTLAYQLVAGEFNFGFKLAFLAPIDRLPIQPYLGASGSAMSASFKFGDNTALSSTFPKTDAQNFYGYNIFVGVDINLDRSWGINFQVEQSKISGTVALQPFALDSNRVFFSLFFRQGGGD